MDFTGILDLDVDFRLDKLLDLRKNTPSDLCVCYPAVFVGKARVLRVTCFTKKLLTLVSRVESRLEGEGFCADIVGFDGS